MNVVKSIYFVPQACADLLKSLVQDYVSYDDN